MAAKHRKASYVSLCEYSLGRVGYGVVNTISIHLSMRTCSIPYFLVCIFGSLSILSHILGMFLYVSIQLWWVCRWIANYWRECTKYITSVQRYDSLPSIIHPSVILLLSIHSSRKWSDIVSFTNILHRTGHDSEWFERTRVLWITSLIFLPLSFFRNIAQFRFIQTSNQSMRIYIRYHEDDKYLSLLWQ